MAALAAETPHNIMGNFADRFDVMERRDHLDAILHAVLVYAEWIVSDTAENAPIGYLTNDTGYIADAKGEIFGAFDRAVERMIDDQYEAAE